MIGIVAKYIPSVALACGAAATALLGSPNPTPLRHPLNTTLPAAFMGAPGGDIPIGADEVQTSGVSDYINRLYYVTKDQPVALYIGYHATQQGDKRMHSPTLCLPGSGWTPVGETRVTVPGANGPATVNRFVLQNAGHQILVYYWFQGRGRLTAGQSELKLNAIKDALLTHRDEEALVRIIVPLDDVHAAPSTDPNRLAPDSVAAQLASAVIPALNRALPTVQ
ncbi:MAG: exosortase C-terminal domain/associated protein EpsI [Gemmatimonadaceae bacterium]